MQFLTGESDYNLQRAPEHGSDAADTFKQGRQDQGTKFTEHHTFIPSIGHK